MRRRYTEEQRTRILTAAARDGLTGRQAAKMLGVSEVTLWKWRKANKPARAHRTVRASSDGSLAALVRAEVQAKVRKTLPGIVREEVGAYLQQVLGSKRHGRVRA